jgi:hypothetical protein
MPGVLCLQPESGVMGQHEAALRVFAKGLNRVFPFAAKATYKVALAAGCPSSTRAIWRQR